MFFGVTCFYEVGVSGRVCGGEGAFRIHVFHRYEDFIELEEDCGLCGRQRGLPVVGIILAR